MVYADTSIIIDSDNIHELLNKKNKVLKSFKKWCDKNNLILNIDKTESILFNVNRNIQFDQLNCNTSETSRLALNKAVLYNIAIDRIINKIQGQEADHKILAFSDDVVLMADVPELQQSTEVGFWLVRLASKSIQGSASPCTYRNYKNDI